MRLRFRASLNALVAFGFACGVTARADDKPAQPPAQGGQSNIDIETIMRARSGGGGGSPSANDPKRYRDFNDITKDATKYDGLFTLHQKDDHLYAEIKPMQFDQPLLVPMMIARGLGSAGTPIGFGDELVVMFHRAGDKVQLIRRNVKVKAPSGTPIEKAVRQNYTDSILMALPIVALNPSGGMSVVIDLSDIFFTDFGQLGLGFLDRNRTTWNKVKAFPNNLELQVQATFGSSGGGRRGGGGGDAVADPRGVTVVLHYSLVRAPDPMYRPRMADDRVGHFLNSTRDFGSNDPESNVVRYINRWRLEKADPKAKLSPPKKQLVWWVEDNVPVEYRPFVEEGILEWNKAFEKIGIRNALAVRWQDGRDDFDPEDINYCTFRWITSGRTYAMSCLRANPLTGEMIDGDVIFDASWINAWKNQYAVATGTPPVAQGQNAAPTVLGKGEIVSSILADQMGFGQLGENSPLKFQGQSIEVVPAEWSGLQLDLLRRLTASSKSCQLATGMIPEMTFAAIALAEPTPGTPGAPKLPDELIGQLIKEVTMHEVGHSLGLRHNFKASTMLTAEQLNDTSITRVKGQVGSVMDYAPINIAPKGQKQGDYVTTTLGPYDYWAIEYAYKPVMGDEDAELKKIASRAPEADLVFATDQDRFFNGDPLVNVYDLGADPAKYAKERATLAVQLMKDLDAKVVKDGEAWARTRVAFTTLMGQLGNAATLAGNYVGGQQVYRDHKGDKNARDPVVPIPGAKQREALSFLIETILSDKSYQFSPALLRRLATDKWEDDAPDFSVNDRVLAIQKIVLTKALSGTTMTRLVQQELQSEPDSNPLKVSEVFRALTNGVFSELDVTPATDKTKPTVVKVSTIRRNLQREYLKRLATMVLGPKGQNLGDSVPFMIIIDGGGSSVPADARALARFHLKEINEKLAKVLDSKDLTLDDTSRAHLDELRTGITRVLGAGIQANEP